MTVKRSKITTNTTNALERGIEILWGAYESSAPISRTQTAEELIHALYADLAEIEGAEALNVPARQWACEQDCWLGLMSAIGTDILTGEAPEGLTPLTAEELEYLRRTQGKAIEAPSDEIAPQIDWDDAESPAERRARNWAKRQAGR